MSGMGWIPARTSPLLEVLGNAKKFSNQVGENYTDAEKSISRLRKIEGLQKEGSDGGQRHGGSLDILDPIFQKDCKKIDVQMVDWMMQQALIPQGKDGQTA
jgi:hypothetical protein